MRKIVPLLLIAGGLLLFNDLVSRLPDIQIDASREKLFTLSSGSRQLLERISRPIEIELYFSASEKTLPVGLRIFAQRVEQLLRQYERGSHGRLKVRIVDPLPGSPEEREARHLGLVAQPIAGSPPFYFGVAALEAGGNRRTIPLVDFRRERLLEYDVSRLVYAVQRPSLPKLAVVSSLEVFGTRGMPKHLQKVEDGTAEWQFVKDLRDSFELQEVVPTAATLPADSDILLVVNPAGFDPRLIHAIDQYVLSGRPAVVLLDPYCYHEAVRRESSGTVLDNRYFLSSDLPDLLSHWGARYSAGEVVGDLAFSTDVPLAKDQSPIHFPLWLTLTTFDDGQPTTAGFDRLLLAYTGRFTSLGNPAVKFTPLLRSSPQSSPVGVDKIGAVDPRRFTEQIHPTGNSSVLAVAMEGIFTTGFSRGKPPPPPGQMEAAEKDPWDLGLKQSAGKSRVILVGDADFLANELAYELVGRNGEMLITRPKNDNFSFLARMLASLEGDLGNGAISPRTPALRPFTRIHEMRATLEAGSSQEVGSINAHLDQLSGELTELNRQAAQGGGSMVSEKALTAIRRVERERTALRDEEAAMDEHLQQAIRILGRRLTFLNFVLVPGLIALVGVLAWFWRTRWRTSP